MEVSTNLPLIFMTGVNYMKLWQKVFFLVVCIQAFWYKRVKSQKYVVM